MLYRQWCTFYDFQFKLEFAIAGFYRLLHSYILQFVQSAGQLQLIVTQGLLHSNSSLLCGIQQTKICLTQNSLVSVSLLVSTLPPVQQTKISLCNCICQPG